MTQISVKQAAEILRISPRSVYSYITDGRLQAERIGSIFVLDEEDVRQFSPNPPGRQRTGQPLWHEPTGENALYATAILVQVCAGQQQQFKEKIREMRKESTYLFPGTVARYITCSEASSTDLEIILIWRKCIMPSAEKRETAIAALRIHLAGVLNWENALYVERKVIVRA